MRQKPKLAKAMSNGCHAKYLMMTGKISRREYFMDQFKLFEGTLTELHCHDLTIDQLKSELDERELKKSGAKKTLVGRLQRAIRGQSTQADKAKKQKSNADMKADAQKFATNIGLKDYEGVAFRLHPDSVYLKFDNHVYSLESSIAGDWHDGYEEQQLMGEEFLSDIVEQANVIVEILETQSLNAKGLTAMYDNLRAMDDTQRRFVDAADGARGGLDTVFCNELELDGINELKTKDGCVSLGETRLEVVKNSVSLPWSLLALRAAETLKSTSPVVQKILKDSKVRSLSPFAWKTRKFVSETTVNDEKENEAESSRPKKRRKRAKSSKKPSRPASTPTRKQEIALQRIFSNNSVWEAVKVKAIRKKGINTVAFGGDSRYDGPKHKRTRGYWYEDVMKELDEDLDADFYDDVYVDTCM